MKRLLLIPWLLACGHHGQEASEIAEALPPGAVLPTDSIVLARLRREHPCLAKLPLVRAGADAPPPDTRCTLVTTAVATIQEARAAPELRSLLRQFRLDDVRCTTVRAEAYRNEATQEIEMPRWVVEFHSDRQPGLVVDIDRRTGRARAYRALEEFGFDAAGICARASQRALKLPRELLLVRAARAFLYDSLAA